MAVARSDRSPLGDLLVEMGLLEKEQLAQVLQQQRAGGGRFIRHLAERRLIDEDRLAKAIAARLGLETVSVASLRIHERVLALIPGPVALRYGALPIAIKRTAQAEFVYLVMADPLDSEAIAELSRVAGRQIRILVGGVSELDRALEQHYRAPVAGPQRPPAAATGHGALPPKRPAAPPAKAEQRPPGPQDSSDGLRPRAPVASPSARSDPSGRVPVADLQRDAPRAPSGDPRASDASRPQPAVPQVLGQPLSPPVDRRARPAGTSPAPTGFNQESKSGMHALGNGAKAPRPEPSRRAEPPRPPPSKAEPAVRRPLESPPAPLRAPPAPSRAEIASSLLETVSESSPLQRELEEARTRLKSWGTPPAGTPLGARPPLAPQAELVKSDDNTSFDPALGLTFGTEVADWSEHLQALEPPSGSTPGVAVRPNERKPEPRGEATKLDLPRTPARNPAEAKAGVLGQAGAPEPSASVEILEPVTTEASLDALAAAHEAALPAAVRVNGGIDKKEDSLEIEIVEPSDGDIKTTQVELGDLSPELAALVVAAPPPKLGASPPPRFDRHELLGSVDLPAESAAGPSPFEGPSVGEIAVGLERTGIIPALDWNSETFSPPPLRPSQSGLSAGLKSDIPESPEAVRARALELETDSEEVHIEPPVLAPETSLGARPDTILDERTPQLAPEKKRRSDPPEAARPPEPSAPGHDRARSEPTISLAEPPPAPLPPFPRPDEALVIPAPPPAPLSERPTISEDSDSEAIPVIEPSSLVSFIDEPPQAPPDTGHDEVPVMRDEPVAPASTRLFEEGDRPKSSPRLRLEGEDEPTNPRIDKKVVRQALDEVRAEPAPAAQEEDPAAELVRRLAAGDSLDSVERAQLVLAIGRVLLERGVITAEELMAALRR